MPRLEGWDRSVQLRIAGVASAPTVYADSLRLGCNSLSYVLAFFKFLVRFVLGLGRNIFILLFISMITILIKFTRQKENREHQEEVLCYNFK